MTIMKSLFSTILSFGILLGSSSQLFSADYSHNPTEVTVLSNNVAIQLEAQDVAIEAIANDVSSKVASNELARTTAGDEGIRRIGALGGYALDEFFEDTYARGPARDKPQFVYTTTNLTITYSDGDIYDPVNGYFKLDSGTKTLTDNAINYAYWSTNDVRIIQWTTGTRPDAIYNIYLATFITSQGRIIYSSTSVPVGDILLYEDAAFAQTFPSLILSGLNVYPTGTALTNIVINSGVEYHNLADRIEHDTVNLNTSSNLVVYTHSNSLWTSVSTNKLLVGMWDNGTNLVACDATKWYRGVFVSLNHSVAQLTWIAPDFEYASEADCLAGSDPDLPPAFSPYIPKCTAYVFKGDDTQLRTDGTYWVDRRNSDNLLKGSVSGGSSGNTPTFSQVLQAGADTGGILPTGMGMPVTDDQGASKGYVDSVGNKASTGTAFVDSETGDDNTARIEKASLPFKTIQAAINACGAVATDTNRFLISISIGTYSENITMSNYISIRGYDIEATIIEGQVTYPTSYTDVTGGEISILSVKMTNAPAFIFNAGSDEAYGGARSCAFYSLYDVDKPLKSVAQISRGNLEIYATCWFQLDVTNNITEQRPATIYHLTTDSGNSGTYQVNSFSSSHILNVVDTNDTVSIVFCNSTNESFFASKSDATHIHLDDSENHDNRVTTIVHKNTARTRSFIDSSIVDVKLNVVNNCDVVAASSTGSVMSAVAHFNNSRIIVPNVNSGNLFYGSSSTTSDVIEIVNSQIGGLSGIYPHRYTEAGSLGQITYFMQHGSGDVLLGGGIDLKAGLPSILPEIGHVKLYTYTYAGLENPMFVDSATNKVRLARDSFYNGYNDETTPLLVGEVVYIAPGLSANGTPIVKRSNASKPETLPAIGVVAQTGGIATGGIGRIMFFGRLENFMNTSAFSSGDKLYLSDTVDGMLTNVLPNATNAIQQIATCHIVSPTNGYVNVRPWKPDTLGGLTPSKYATYSNPVFASSSFMITNSSAAKFSTADIPVGTTNTYVLPSVGGTLATYTDIQLVPVSCVVGEPDGIVKGRVVYQSGVVGGKPQVKYADRRNTENLPIIGVATASGGLGDIIEVANFGPVNGFDTSSFGTSDMMYLGTNGMLSGASSVSSEAIIMMGTCLASDSVTGSMLVNIRSYYQDGAFAGSLRYSVKNASTAANAVAAMFAINDTNESVRMVVRGSGNTKGRGAIISTSANGPFWYSNNRRKPLIWDIDMTDTGDEFTHLNWPMMSLVPQIATSNAFFGIGTTNPLAMLHVVGSGIINSNLYALRGFKTSSNGYSTNEWITYKDSTDLMDSRDTVVSNAFGSADTSLSNSLINVMDSKDTSLSNSLIGVVSGKDTVVSNAFVAADTSLSNSLINVMDSKDTSLSNSLISTMNSKDTVVSNAFVAADTNLQGQINVETNRAYVAETNLSNRINIETNRAIQVDLGLTNAIVANYTNLNNSIIAETNRAYGAETNLSNRINAETNRAYGAETNLSNRINAETNRAYGVETNLQRQVTDSTNRIAVIENRTNIWNLASTSVKFYANMGSVTQTFADTTAQRVQYTNSVLNVGGVYSNQVFRWIPGASNVMVRILGNLGVNMANNSIAYIYIYKNGSQKCTVFSKRTTNAGEELLQSYTFTDITTNAADYYEVWASIAGGGAQLNGNNDNWWSGQIVY
jgi:hypothetical protein